MSKRGIWNGHQAVTAVLAQRAKWRVEKARLLNRVIVRCKTKRGKLRMALEVLFYINVTIYI